MPQPAFQDLVPTGFLTDRGIRLALDHGYLMEPGTWEASQLRHASYTIRLGHKIEVHRNPVGSGERDVRIVQLTTNSPPFELRPGDTALLYSLENLRLPDCVLGFTVARGLLVVESLVPENTYVDPGFSNPIYTTVTNLSGRVLKLSYGMPIARLFFYRLAESVQQPYQTGPSKGIGQHLDFLHGVAFPSVSEARLARETALLDDLITTERGGARTGELLRRNAVLSRVALLTAVLLPFVLQIAFAWPWLRDSAGGFMTGVVSSIVASALVIVGERLWRRFAGPA